LNIAQPEINKSNFNKAKNNKSRKKSITFEFENWTFQYSKHPNNSTYGMLDQLWYNSNKKKKLFRLTSFQESKSHIHPFLFLEYHYKDFLFEESLFSDNKFSLEQLIIIRKIFSKYKSKLNSMKMGSPVPTLVTRMLKPSEGIKDYYRSYKKLVEETTPPSYHINYLKGTFSFLTEQEMKLIAEFHVHVETLVFKKLTDLIKRSEVLSLNSVFLAPNRGEAMHSFSPFDTAHPLSKILKILVNNISTTNISRNNEDNFIDKDILATTKKINKWLEIFGMGNSFELDTNNPYGRITPIIVKNGHKQTLPELGYGYSQLLPIILVTAIYNPSLISNPQEDIRLFISEPEIHLHPNLQSKLGDLFLDYIEDKGNLVIETHSEYLIRKIQYLVALGKLKPEQVAIYYFKDPNIEDKGKDRISRIHIREDGSLSDDFGPGFFDEATNIKFDLLRLKNTKNN